MGTEARARYLGAHGFPNTFTRVDLKISGRGGTATWVARPEVGNVVGLGGVFFGVTG